MSSSDSTTLTANWSFPTRLLVGSGRSSELAALCRELGLRRPLFVTDPGLCDLPMTIDRVAELRAAGLAVEIFADVHGNPTGADVDAGVKACKNGQHDGVIGFGGGSALDTAKAIALMVDQERPLWDFEDVGDNWKRAVADAILPVIAVPTTAGTGSEVGRASVITREQDHRKLIIFHPHMLPAVVILDPEVTRSLPADLTAATGLDAFSHCFEAWCAPGYHPMADGIALEGMRLIAEALPRAYANGDDLEARTDMLVAASMGATAFQKGLGAVHAISHPVGAIHHTHHGLTNAIVLPYVMQFNRTAIADRMQPLARVLGVQGEDFEAVYEWVIDFLQHFGIPSTLADIGVDITHADDIGRLGEIDPPAATNPVPVTAADLRNIFMQAVQGPRA